MLVASTAAFSLLPPPTVAENFRSLIILDGRARGSDFSALFGINKHLQSAVVVTMLSAKPDWRIEG